MKTSVLRAIVSGHIRYAGHRPGKIYGTLSCSSGKRMKAENRVFFRTEQHAIDKGYRPCGHCLPEKFQAWKTLQENKALSS